MNALRLCFFLVLAACAHHRGGEKKTEDKQPILQKNSLSNPEEKAQEKKLRQQANEAHLTVRTTTDPNEGIKLSIEAEQYYRDYFKAFPYTDFSYEVRYNFAELLFDLGDYYKKNRAKDADGTLQEKYYVDAFNQYTKIIEEQPKGKYAKNCANSNITLAYNMFEIEEKKGIIKMRKNSRDLEVIELAPWEEKYLNAMESYVELYPESKETIDYLYEAGNTLFDKNRLDEAAVRFRKVIAMEPTSKQARYAARGILEALAFRANAMFHSEKYAEALKNYVALRDASKDFYEQNSLGKGNKRLEKQFYEYFELASAKVIETRFKASDQGKKAKLEAASGYRQFVDDFPKSKVASEVLFMAGYYFTELEHISEAHEALDLLLQNYPNFRAIERAKELKKILP